MKDPVKLAIFPLLSAIFLVAAAAWTWEIVANLRRDGHRPAQIVGMLKAGAGRFDVVRDVEREVVIAGAGGVEWRRRANAREAALPDAEFRAEDNVPADVRWALLFDDAGAVERAAQRLARRWRVTEPLRVTVTETARGYFGLAQKPERFALENLAPADLAETARFNEVVTRLTFLCAQDGTVRDREIVREPDGAAIRPERADFIFAGETWQVEYRPIFRFGEGEAARVELSDIGRIFAPSRAYPLGGRARVVLTPQGEAILLPDLGTGEAPQGALAWFSAKSEAIFSRWAYPLVLAAFGCGFGLLGAVLISLRLWPSRRLE